MPSPKQTDPMGGCAWEAQMHPALCIEAAQDYTLFTTLLHVTKLY